MQCITRWYENSILTWLPLQSACRWTRLSTGSSRSISPRLSTPIRRCLPEISRLPRQFCTLLLRDWRPWARLSRCHLPGKLAAICGMKLLQRKRRMRKENPMERSQRLQKAQDFTWRNARLIERYLFTCLFDNGSKEPVLAALRAYQNEDGGFGNALEPDKRCPSSQPQDIEIALHILDAIGTLDELMVIRACDYLVTITTPEGGVPYALPSVNAYPHAPWWTVEENPPASLNPTAAIAGLLFKYGIQGCWMPYLKSRPAIAAVGLSEAGGFSSTVHQGACG